MAFKAAAILLLLISLNVPFPAACGEPNSITNDNHEESTPLWSPDGKQISFIAKQRGRLCLVLFSLRSRTQNILIEDVSAKGSYSWSPDGKFIAYTAKNNGRLTVSLIELGVNKIEMLHEGKNPVFSPDSNHIAFVTGRNVLVYHVGLKKAAQLTDEKEDAVFGHLIWAPAGDRIYYCRNGDLWSIFSDGTDKKCVVNHVAISSPPPFIDNPAVSANANAVYFSIITDGLWSHPTNNILACYNISTGKTDKLFEANSWALSPSGKFIAYSLGQDIMIFETGSRKLIKCCEGFEPSYSNNNDSIVYLRREKESYITDVWFSLLN
jgi:Tol biopolymer transport system component